MDSLYLLIPLSALLVLAILAVFGWAVQRGQFEDLEREGQRILEDERQPGASSRDALDDDQAAAAVALEESARAQPTTKRGVQG